MSSTQLHAQATEQECASDVARKRLWARVEYDGTAFFGFQIQARERTVQGEIERALRTVTGEETRIAGAGRTDRGVHARGQMIGFRAQWRHGLDQLQQALNAVLAPDLSIPTMGAAADDFHPRFSARSRSYRYTVLNQRWPSALARRKAWHVKNELDVGRMDQASRILMGTHDFAAFGRPPQGDNTVRTVLQADWQQQQTLVILDIKANAFLYRMVRNIVGTLVQVGRGQVTVQGFEAILESRNRSRIKLVAPAQGLCLTGVDYPEGVLK